MRYLICILVALIACGGGDGGGGNINAPRTTATITGSVRDGATQSPIAGATVRIGTAVATSGGDGAFTIQNVPVGSATINVTAPGFEAYAQIVTITSATTTHQISLTRATVYNHGQYVAYLPPSVAAYRGVLFLLPGARGDSRPFVRGLPSCWADPIDPCPSDPDFRQRLLALAEQHGLALFGANTTNAPANFVGTYDDMLAAVTSIAQQSGRTELAGAPLLLIGSSLGGCIAHGFTRLHADRVIGFMSAKGSCHFAGVSDARLVPGYLFIGEEDMVSPAARTTITDLFLANRSENARWALAVEPGAGHEWPRNNAATVAWMDAVLTRRLPATGTSMPLRAIDEPSGWLANRSTREISPFGCYRDHKGLASWLPNEQTARDWQAVVGGGVVNMCP